MNQGAHTFKVQLSALALLTISQDPIHEHIQQEQVGAIIRVVSSHSDGECTCGSLNLHTLVEW